MKKEKLLKKLLVGAVSATMIVGLFASTAMAATTTQVATLEDSVQSTEISLESIAALNNCTVDDLNTVYDDDGYLTFVGNQLSTDKITNVDEAYSYVMEDLSDLLKLDDGDISLSYFSTETSPNTDIYYYRFNQVITTKDETTGKETPLKYLNKSLKLGVDKDGYPTLISADLTHENMTFDVSNILTKEEAENIVKPYLSSAKLYSDYTTLGVWSDKLIYDITGADSTLAWMVYTDNMSSSTTEEKAPYTVWIIIADKTAKAHMIGCMPSYSLEEYSSEVSNPSLHFFDNMEDKGEYTYTLNLDWVSDTDKAAGTYYNGGTNNEITVTVPVMYNAKEDLYYLGESKHHITMSNYNDYKISAGNLEDLNPYVTKTPDDPSSWHFKNDGTSTLGREYFDNYNYVLASFSKYVEVIYAFGEKMSLFTSHSDSSYLLCTYIYDYSYPDNEDGFMVNANNAGVRYGWTVFNTSPSCVLCLETNTMCHEFTHGVNQLFTSAQYKNEMGAVMESFADMVGIQMGFQMDGDNGSWNIGGVYSQVYRSMSNPTAYQQAMYKDGMYYVNPVEDVLLDSNLTDCGGVHRNSGVPNYLGYQFVNDASLASDEATISTKEGLNLWYEALYMSTSSTEFIDLGAYLEFAADKLGFTTEQKNHINRLIKELGFEDGQVDSDLLNSEVKRDITVTLDFEDEKIQQDYYFCTLFSYQGPIFPGGGFENNTTQKIAAPGFDDIGLCYKTADSTTARAWTYFGETEDNLLFHVKKIDTVEGSNIKFTKNETIKNESVPYGLSFDSGTEESNASVVVNAVGNYIVITKTGDEYNLYIIEASDAAGHEWDTDYTIDKAATLSASGQKSIHCKDGEVVKDIEMIEQIKSVKLSATSKVYTGKVQKPSVKVTDADGNALKLGTDYTVSYSGNFKTVGKYTVKVTFKGNYSGSKTLNYKIVKASQKLKVTTKVKTVKYSKVKKAKQTVKPITKVTGKKGTLRYKIIKYGNAKAKKYLSINKKTGKVTVKKGAPKGKYKIKVKVTSSATANFYGKSVTKVITVKVK